MIRQKIRLGDLLVNEGLISQDDLMRALSIQKKYRENGVFKKIGEILIEEGLITEKQMSITLAKQLGLEFVDLYGEEIDYDLLSSFPINLIKTSKVLPFKETEDYIYVATADPLDYESLEMIERMIVRKPIKIYIAQTIDILNIIERLEIVISTKTLTEQVKKELKEGANIIDSEDTAISKLTELVLKTAINQNASDIHIEPEKHGFSIRSRIDGVLKEIFSFDREIYGAFISKIKLLSDLDISEKRRSQDGRFSLELEGNKVYDFRVSTTPTLLGESIVMRILDQQKILLKLEELGMNDHNLNEFQRLIHSPYGIVFVTGPTGSGKTTTLYAALNEIKSLENKVITVEDPVEYQIPLVQQIPVNPKVGYGFAEALRTILRQDPDVIMIGEVRDTETLNAAIQASLTGHLVLATLHTNDAISAITRMVQMGAEPYLVADSLIGVVAQRLVRKICPYCKEEYKPTPDIMMRIGKYFDEHTKSFIGKGCKRCNMTGYLGREMVSEVFSIDDEISHMIANGADKYKILEKAKAKGYKTLTDDVVEKVAKGITTISELLRVAKV
jgi:type II secretory ATPase GspE/PulE/Tfp pilus assembly ATPase PilB-like protein